MSEEDYNLAAEIFTPEPEEHDQALVCTIRVAGEWIAIVPGSLDLIFNDQGDVEYMADTPLGAYLQGKLSDITGLRSIEAPDETEED